MSSATPLVPGAKAPFFLAAGLWLAAAGLIGGLAILPLGWADVLGMVACAAAAAVFVTIPFVVDFVRRLDAARAPLAAASVPAVPPVATAAPTHTPVDTSAQIAALVDAHLAAALPVFTAQLAAATAEAEEKRRAEVLASVAATTPTRVLDTDTLPPTAAGAKPRLGRGLLGLMHAPGAISPSGARPAEPSANDDAPTSP